MFYRKRKKELLKEAAKKVMPILKKHPDLCILFAYDILALTYYFFDNKINIERFPICICGRNKNTTAKIVANIFCNMQFFDPCKPNTIPSKTNIHYTRAVILESFKKYISSIFLDKTLSPYYFYTEGIEKRGKRETCYYFEFCHFYSDFCNKNIGIAIDERSLLNILKTSKIIKTKDDVSYGVERKFEGMKKKIYVLAVIKEKI